MCLKQMSSFFTTTSHNKESRNSQIIRLLFCPLVLKITPSPPPEDISMTTFSRLSLSLPKSFIIIHVSSSSRVVVFTLMFFFPSCVCCFLPSKKIHHLLCFLSSFSALMKKFFSVVLLSLSQKICPQNNFSF